MRRLAVVLETGEGEVGAEEDEEPPDEARFIEALRDTFDAKEVGDTNEVRHEHDAPGSPAHAGRTREAQEEATEIVEASAGGGMVTVNANGAGEVVSITIDPRAIDPVDRSSSPISCSLRSTRRSDRRAG